MSGFEHLENRLTTARLALRPLQAGDASAIERLVSDPDISSRTASIPHPYPEGEAERFLARMAERRAEGVEMCFAITILEEGPGLVGAIGVFVHEGDDDVEVGYWIGKPWWGRGYMAEAVDAATGFARRWRPEARIVGLIFPDNEGSRRVLEKCGFAPEGNKTCKTPARDTDSIEADLYVLRDTA